MQCSLLSCTAGDILPLSAHPVKGCAAHIVCGCAQLPSLAVGTELFSGEKALFRVVGRVFLPAEGGHSRACPLIKALSPIEKGEYSLSARRKGWALAWITLSDKGAQGAREDTAGPCIESLVQAELPLSHAQGFILPDDAPSLSALLAELACGQGYDLICTTGGTGVGPRDFTPQATKRVLDYELPGFSQAMMAASLAKTSRAVISRAVAGVIGQSLVINLPGSRKAVSENLAAVLPALSHTLEKLHGDPADCGAVQ